MIPLHPPALSLSVSNDHCPLPVTNILIIGQPLGYPRYVVYGGGTKSHYNYRCICPQPILIATLDTLIMQFISAIAITCTARQVRAASVCLVFLFAEATLSDVLCFDLEVLAEA